MSIKSENLSQEEQNKLEHLTNPDEPRNRETIDPAIEGRIFAGAVSDVEFARHIAQQLKALDIVPWTTTPLCEVWSIIARHVAEFASPPVDVLAFELGKKFGEKANERLKAFFESASGHEEQDLAWVRKQADEWFRLRHVKRHLRQAAGLLKKGLLGECLKMLGNPPIQDSAAQETLADDLPDPEELFKLTDCDLKWFIEDNLPAGMLMLVHGDAKAGKTTFLQQMLAEGIIHGQTLGAQVCEPYAVLVLDYENPTATFKKYIWEPIPGKEKLTGKFRVVNRQCQDKRYKLPPYVTADYLRGLIKRFGPNTIIVIDSLRRALGRTPDLPANWEWSSSVISGLLDPLAEVAHSTGATISIIHHNNNSGKSSGSTDLIAVPDVIWHFQKNADEDRLIEVSGRVPNRTFAVRMENGYYHYVGGANEYKKLKTTGKRQEDVNKIIAVLQVGPKSAEELMTETSIAKANFYKLAGIMKDKGILEFDKRRYSLAEGYGVILECWRGINE